MLEIKNLTKVYRSKTGESVCALDDVSVSFPESGMVFILGKSGSGKSTLLNVIGGLDGYDKGEFIIKGKSSKSFSGSDFDAYRNTFIGFIFQEYNILDDFTVGANIALALELQGKKATSESINNILAQVDLVNYAKRKPNELSGGQKQRVAIARALVKEPQIIMADEPTGALDSNTGKQIFDSLKQLSREKLVLIVSHDRDFAEKYADRIIELSDGKIISDVTKHEHESEKLSEGVDKISNQILRIKGGYKLTATDLEMINEYLSKSADDVILSSDGRINSELRSVAGITEQGNMSVFEGTDAERDVKIKKYEKKDSKFIRSRLPLKNALRMGASGLKHKKFRLVMTIFLSLIAFVMFGFADTMAAYNKFTATTESLMDSNVKNASITLSVRHTATYGDNDSHTYYSTVQMNDNDIKWLKEQTSLNFVPVYTGITHDAYYGGFQVNSHMQSFTSNIIYTGRIHGLVDISAEELAGSGFTVMGRLPEKQGEIAITELMYRQFNEYGFVNTEKEESIKAGSVTMEDGTANSIIGKHISFSGMKGMYIGEKEISYEIVGIVDTQFDYDRYAAFLPKDEDDMMNQGGNAIGEMVLQMEIYSELGYGFHGLGFMCREDIDAIASSMNTMYEQLATPMNAWNSDMRFVVVLPSTDSENQEQYNPSYSQVADSSVLEKLDITWLDGVSRDKLAADEIVLPSYFLNNLMRDEAVITLDAQAIANEAARLYGAENWAATKTSDNYFNRLMEAAARQYISDIVWDDEMVWNVSEFAQMQYGQQLNGAEEAKEFWIRFWFEEYRDEPPMFNNDGSFKFKSDFDRAVRADMLPFMADMYGIQDTDGISVDNMWSLYEILYNTGEENPEYTIWRHQIQDMMRMIYADADFYDGRLWENQEFINLMLDNKDFGVTEQNWNDFTDDDKIFRTRDFYLYWFLNNANYGYLENKFGDYNGSDLEKMAKESFMNLCGTSVEEILQSLTFKTEEYNYEFQNTTDIKTYDFKIVGTYDVQKANHTEMVVSDTLMADYITWRDEIYEKNQGDYTYREDIAEHEDGIWAYALSPMGRDRDVIQKLVDMSYAEEGVDLKFELQNPIMDTLGTFNEFIEMGSKIFLIVGIVFAVFSALLLMNFIATSISYKKREIGVLRAVGARSSDVFKIFFSEALIIALINFILSTAVVIAGIVIANGWMHNNGINITVLTYGIRQFVLMLVISAGVALLASFLPVYNIARRKPVDAIKDR